MRRKLSQFFDKKFFIFVALVFLGTFGAGLVFSSEEIKTSNNFDDFGKLVAEVIKKESFDPSDGDVEEQQTENSSAEVLGEETEKEVVVTETFVQGTGHLSTDSVDLIKEANSAVFQLINILEEGELSSFYELLGEDLRGTFEKEEFSQITSTSLNVKKVRVLSGPEVSDDWSEVVIELIFNDGSKKQYITVFHLENGEWKLFGTEEL